MEQTSDKKEKLQKYLRKIEAGESFRDKGYRDKWERYYKRWRNHVDAIEDKTRSNISVPYTFVQVETILPRLVETLFAARPYVAVKGRTRNFANNASSMQTLLDYQQNEVFDIQDIFHIGLKIMAVYGTTVAYIGWKYKEREVIKKQFRPVLVSDPISGDDIVLTDRDLNTGEAIPVEDWQPTKMTDVEYDDPEVKFLDLGLFYVDPNAEDIEDARYCGHVCYHSKADLEDLERQGVIDEINWSEIPNDDKKNEARNRRMSSVGLPTDNAASSQDPDDNLYEVHYHWEDDKWVIIINRCYIARDGDNPFWHKKKPYVKDTYTKVPKEFYGIGVVEIIEDQQDELNTERNMRIDYRAHNLRRMFKVKRGANINPKDLVWRQNGRIMVDEMDSVEVFNPPSISGDSFNQEALIKADMRDATGAHDVVMGTGSGGTATETMSKDNNASMRFKLVISSAEKRLLVGISRFMMQLNQQFVDNVRVLPIYDQDEDDWPEITPEDIQGEFHLIAAGSSVEPMANKEAFKQRMVELYSIVSNDPFMQQYPDKRRNLLKKVLEAFDVTDTEGLLPSDDELAGMMNDQAIQQFLSTLPPELQQILTQYTQPPPQPLDSGIEHTQIGGGANTAAQTEQGLYAV